MKTYSGIALGMAFAAFAPASNSYAAVVDYIQVDNFEAGPDCSVPLTCPAQSGGKACISGRLVSAASADPLRAAFQPGLACGSGATGGPCDLSLNAYDLIAFAGNPSTATPLPSTEKIVDGCGRFRISGLTPPVGPFVALVTDDADLAAENDLHVPGASTRAISANASVDGVPAIVVRRDTVARWTLTAGNPFAGNTTFADAGALLLQYRVDGAPRAGVTVLQNGVTIAPNDYYFTDAAPGDRLNAAAAPTATGANGSALVANGGQGLYGGTGGEPVGCTWLTTNSTTVPGVVFYAELGVDCPQ